jgi:hypothetical protein
MASTRSIETQHSLLGLLATLLGVSKDDDNTRYENADIPKYAEQLLNIESISLSCVSLLRGGIQMVTKVEMFDKGTWSWKDSYDHGWSGGWS